MREGFIFHKVLSAIFERLNRFIEVPFCIQEFLQKTNPNTRRFLRDIKGIPYDLIIANDIGALIQGRLAQGNAKLLYDAHEYSLDQYSDTVWQKKRRPYLEYLLRKHLKDVDKIMTVSNGIADMYEKTLHIARPVVIINAPEMSDLVPKIPEPGRIRMVHHGVAAKLRMIEELVKMMDLLDDRFELDFYLVTSDKKYYAGLLRQYAGNRRIKFREPVPMPMIPKMLNEYDIGLALFAPRTVNLKYVLPNKFFEFVQGRVAVGIGPSVEMAEYVREYNLGVVAQDFTAEAMADVLSPLTGERILEFKRSAQQYAYELSAQPQMEKLKSIVESLIGK